MRFSTILLLLLAPLLAVAQQDYQLTNFMFNKLAYNPACAGHKGMSSLSAIHRTQWTGMPGAPNSQNVAFQTVAAEKRLGLGLLLQRDQIGFSQNFDLTTAYAYRMPLGDGTLAIGAQASIRNYRTGWSQSRPDQQFDTEIPLQNVSDYRPNFGAGIYYEHDNFHVGVAAPRLLEDGSDPTGARQAQVDARHYFLSGGLRLPLSDKVEFMPNAQLKAVAGAPMNADLNASFRFNETLTTGLTYRTSNALSALVHLRVKQQLCLGVSYDYWLRNSAQLGHSFEVLLGYDFSFKPGGFQNPRFF